MATYETDAGAVYHGGETSEEAARADAEERVAQEQAFSERQAAPPPRPSDATTLKPGWPLLETWEQIERFRAEIKADDYHPAHGDPELMNYYATAQWRLSGKPFNAAGQPVDPETGETGERELLPDGRLRAPEDNPPIRLPVLSAAAQAAGFGWNESGVTAITALADASGLPRYHTQLFYEDLAAAADEEAAAEEGSTRASGMAALIRLEGADRARQIAADAHELFRRCAESRFGDLKDAMEDLTPLGNNARALIGAARFYRELCNLPPQGPWAEILLSDGERWAQERTEGKVRAAAAARAAQTPDDTIVSYGGRP